SLRHGPSGIVNVVPRDALSLLTALHVAEKVTVPVPHPVAYAASDLLWGAGVGEAPGAFVDYARFLCVAEGEKARRVLGFAPRHRSRDALDAFLAYRYPEKSEEAVEAQGGARERGPRGSRAGLPRRNRKHGPPRPLRRRESLRGRAKGSSSPSRVSS